MSNNLAAKRLEPRSVRQFVEQLDVVYLRLLRKKSFEQVVFFQPALKNVSKIGRTEIDSYLLPYLLKNLQISITKLEREEVMQSMYSRSATSPDPRLRKDTRDRQVLRSNNPFEQMLATQSLVDRLHNICYSNSTRNLQEAFWRMRVKSNRVDESKLFLLSMLPLIRKFKNRRLNVFASDSQRLLASNPQVNKGVVFLNQFMHLKNIEQEKNAINQLKTYQKILEFYERIYEEPAVDVKQCCLRIISEFDRRPNSFGSIVGKRADYLRFLLIFKLLHDISETNTRLKYGAEFMDHLKQINVKPKIDPEEVKTMVNVLNSLAQERKYHALSIMSQLPSPVRPKSRILMSQVITSVEIDRSRVYNMRNINTFCLLLQDVFNRKKKKAMYLMQTHCIRSQNTKKQKIIYARVEFLKKPPTMGSFVLPDVTQVITPRANMSTTLGPYQSPMTSSKISEIISFGSSNNQKRAQHSTTLSKRHCSFDQVQ